MSESDCTRAPIGVPCQPSLPLGRLIRIHPDDYTYWRSKPTRDKLPKCREPLTDDELPDAVVVRAAELFAIQPYSKGRKKTWDVTGGQWQAIREYVFARSGGLCVYCGAKAEHIDHVIPVSKFGSWHPDNCAAACVHCNCSKGCKTHDEWRPKQ